MGLFSWLSGSSETESAAITKPADLNKILVKTGAEIIRAIEAAKAKALTPLDKAVAAKTETMVKQTLSTAKGEGIDFARKKKEEMKWNDVNEPVKYVCQGAKVLCMYCSVPIGDIMVTSTQVKLQDTFWATNGDRNGAPAPNIVFKGLCMHPRWGISRPPCISVIQLGVWKNVSQTHIDNYNALLRKSTIPCLHSMQDIQIIHSGQKCIPEELKIKTRKFPRIREIYWMDAEMENKITAINFQKKASILVRTKDYDEGDNITVKITGKNGNDVADGQKEIILNGTVDSQGIVRYKEKYEWYINENSAEDLNQ